VTTRGRIIGSVASMVVAAAIAASAASGAGALAPRKPCGKFSGPAWAYPSGAPSGSTYTVTAIGAFTCKSATSWVKKLVNDAAPSHANTFNPNVLKNGPSGYRCAATSSKQDKAFAGDCEKGPKLNATSGFSWAGVP
jgi:hypothetical protein